MEGGGEEKGEGEEAEEGRCKEGYGGGEGSSRKEKNQLTGDEGWRGGKDGKEMETLVHLLEMTPSLQNLDQQFYLRRENIPAMEERRTDN